MDFRRGDLDGGVFARANQEHPSNPRLLLQATPILTRNLYSSSFGGGGPQGCSILCEMEGKKGKERSRSASVVLPRQLSSFPPARLLEHPSTPATTEELPLSSDMCSEARARSKEGGGKENVPRASRTWSFPDSPRPPARHTTAEERDR